MAKSKNSNKSVNSKNNIFLVLNLVLAVVTMAFCATLVGSCMAKQYKQAAVFLGVIILLQVGFQILLFIVKDRKKDKIRALIVGIIYVCAAIVAFMANEKNYIFYYISNAIILIAMSANQFLQIEKSKAKKGIVSNILLGSVLLFLGVSLLLEMVEKDFLYINLVAVLLFLFLSFKKIIFPTFKLEKMKLLLDILVKTHTIDVLVCLVAFVIAFSFALPMFEKENISNFWDAMWYCFTVITTIGFGDFYAKSTIGRILTVILGIYGIVVVAILTSVIVNFYNEVSAKEKARDIIE